MVLDAKTLEQPVPCLQSRIRAKVTLRLFSHGNTELKSQKGRRAQQKLFLDLSAGISIPVYNKRRERGSISVSLFTWL